MARSKKSPAAVSYSKVNVSGEREQKGYMKL
jgi:hypothetical protein